MNKKQTLNFIGLAISCALLPVSAEIIPGTDLSINFESGHIVGSGRHLNMNRVPVTDINTGNTTLYDASFKFTFTPADGFIFEQISSVAFSSSQAVANITPGVYQAQSGALCYSLEGPTILNSNRSIYTFRGVTGVTGCSNSQDGFAAQIASGAATGHPDIGDRDIVPNLKDSYVYGYISNKALFNTTNPINSGWEQNELIGIRQSGDQLIIGLFSEGTDTNDVPNDFKDPVETAILTKINQ